MPRILHLIASNSIGGPEKQLLHHAYDARSAAYDVVLGSFQDASEPPEFLTVASRHGIETAAIPGGVRPHLVEDLAQFLRLRPIDLLCTHGYMANVVGHFAAKQAHVPCVPFVRGWNPESEPAHLYERLEQSVLVRSPWVVCSSQADARLLSRLRRGRPAPLVIQNAVLRSRESASDQADAPTRRELGLSGNSFLFGAAARLTREKGHRYLLEAFALLQRMIPAQDVHLLLVGEGAEESSLRGLARRLGIEARVRFAGAQRKPSAWIRRMNCMVQPSLTQGSVHTILEAMQLGVPVIATAVSGVPEVIQHEHTGLLVPASAHIPLAEAMKKIVRSAPLRRDLTARAQSLIARNFSAQHQRGLLELLYKTLLGDAFPLEVEVCRDGVA